MNVRPATAADAPAIARLHVASWQRTYRNELPPAFLEAIDESAWAERWGATIADESKTVVVAEDEGAVIGFVACGPTRDADADRFWVYEVYNLHVTASFQGSGVGRALMEAALERAQAAGAAELRLWVVSTNAGARRFYERLAMECDGARQAHPVGDGAQLDEVRYRLHLPGRAAAPAASAPRPRLSPSPRLLALAVAGIALLGSAALLLRPRAPSPVATAAAPSAGDPSLERERQAARREIERWLRPPGGEHAEIGRDPEARFLRLGHAYARLANIEERAGDPWRRDHYVLLARQSLRTAGVKDLSDEAIRRLAADER